MTPPRSVAAPPARQAALETVRRAEHRSTDLQAALDGVLSSMDLSPQDAALATELSYGYFRFRDRLRFVLGHYFAKPGGITEPVWQALGLAAYEVLFLDRVPDYASVDWAVEHVKRIKPSLANVANAVLRNVARLGPAAHGQDFYAQDDPPRAELWARFYSCPRWIVEQWIEAYGPERAEAWLRAGLAKPPLGVRVNAARDGAADLLDVLCARGRVALRLPLGAALDDVPLEWLETLVRQGLITRQSAAGQQAMEALGADRWPWPVWDACAGRGGKTGWLAERAPASDGAHVGPVWASDRNMGRLKGLGREMSRLGLRALVFRASAADAPPLRRAPRTIFLDAPCSGLGVLSRRPDSRYKRTPDDLPHLEGLQSAMLARAAEALPSGGVLAYVTCTVRSRENEDQVRGLLRSRRDLTLETECSTEPDSPLREFFYGAALRKG